MTKKKPAAPPLAAVKSRILPAQEDRSASFGLGWVLFLAIVGFVAVVVVSR